MRFRSLHPNVKLRLFMQFLGGISHSMVIPMMSIYFADKVGQTVTGLMLIVIFLGGAVGTLFGGTYADRYGRKKVMIVSESVVVVTYLFITFFNSPWMDAPYLTFVAFVVNVAFGTMFGPASQAMLLDVTTADDRKFVFTLSYWINNLSLGIGVMIGAQLYRTHLLELFSGLTAVTLLSVLVTVFWITETYQPKRVPERETATGSAPKQEKSNMWKTYRQVLKDTPFAFYLLASVLVVAMEFLFSEYGGIRLHREMEMQPVLPGVPFTWNLDGVGMFGQLKLENTLLVVLLAPFVAKWTARLANNRLLLGGVLLSTAGFAVLSVSITPWLLMLAMLVVTVGELMYVPVRQAMLGDLAPEHARSTYMAMYNFSFIGGMQLSAIGVTVSGFLGTWMMCGVFVLLGAGGMLAYVKSIGAIEQRKRAEHTAQSPSPGQVSVS